VEVMASCPYGHHEVDIMCGGGMFTMYCHKCNAIYKKGEMYE